MIVSLSDSIDGRLSSGSGDSLVGIGDMLIALGSGHGGCPPPPLPPAPPSLPPPPPSPPDTIGASLDNSGGRLSPLNVGDPLVGAGDVLIPLETGGGVIDVSEATPLGGTIDCSWLGIGLMDSVDVCSEGMDAGLEIGGTLGCDVGDRLVPIDGSGLIPDPEPADGSDPGDAEGGVVLDGPTVEDTLVGEPELGWADVSEPALLGPVDVVPELIPDGAMLLTVGETCELAGGLVEPLALADDRKLDVGLLLAGGGGLPEIGDPELGVVMLDAADIPLLGIADDVADGLPTLDAIGLATDDASDGGRLPDDVTAELPTLTGEDCPELAVDGTLETPLGTDDPLGRDEPLSCEEPLGGEDALGEALGCDDPLGCDDIPEPLDWLSDDPDESDGELPEPIDAWLSDDG